MATSDYGPPPVSTEPALGGKRPTEADEPVTLIGDDGKPCFLIVQLSLGVDGGIRAVVQRKLTTAVYNRGTALKYVAWAASQMPASDAVLIMVRPAGTIAGVWAVGSGKKAPARVASKARRMLKAAVPSLFAAAKAKRQARRTSRRGPPRKRRTSRKSAR